MPYSLSEEMQNKYPGKPLINSEPCYEEMGYSGQMYGRWTRFDVRRCAFMSILSGACAGITYGAAGIYSWHKVKKSFESSLGEGFDMPKSWEEAMSFTGAWDYGYIKAIFEELKVNSIIPKQDILINDTNDIRVAQANNGLIFVYVPYNTTIRLSINLDGWSIKAVDLAERFIANIKMIVKEKHTVIDMHPFSQDALLILKKENDLYLVADYILDSDIILNLSKVRKPKDISGSSFEGYSITFNENGALQKKSFFNNGKLEGEEIEYNYFGIPQIINNYKNGNLINTIYLDAE